MGSDPVIVVGSGIAGALFAIHAAPRADVVALSRPGAYGSTPWAQGGIAAAIADDDSPAHHEADTVAAGAGLVDRDLARAMCQDGPRQVATLRALGVGFDSRDGHLALGREGAHSARRVAHADGDATGARIAEALGARLRSHSRASLVRETVVGIDVADGHARGVWTVDDRGALRHRPARAVVLATGGLGAVFLRTTNPPEALGDGPALAASAGAALADLEFVQFHPTALAIGDGGLPLISEAVRGEGAVLRDAREERFMADEHPLAELAPRDVVARAIARVAARDGRDPTLHLAGFTSEAARSRFPTVAAACAAHGLDLAADPIPVTPAAHYSVGGVMTDLTGRSTVPGLYAIGECAATGVHGANRLASNSLLEAAVMAERAAGAVVRDDGSWPDWGLPGAAHAPEVERRDDDPGALTAIRQLAWEDVGVERSGGGLRRAVECLAERRTSIPRDAALAIAQAALFREESRGAHFRSDYPHAVPSEARRVAWLSGEPFPLSPAHPHATRTAA